ncbi:MAG: DUF2283 domain-containing protein [Candidatus Babeliales bacterium]|jgi:uncharacterized protein YuzE
MLSLNYDKKHDILYISIGTPKPSYGEEDTPGIVVLKDMSTNEITGITIFDFMDRINKNTISDINFPISIDFKEVTRLLS